MSQHVDLGSARAMVGKPESQVGLDASDDILDGVFEDVDSVALERQRHEVGRSGLAGAEDGVGALTAPDFPAACLYVGHGGRGAEEGQ